MVEKHYTAQELAALLGLNYETVLLKAQTGEIVSVRFGRLRRFPESAVQAYLDRHRENVIQLRPRVPPPTREEA